MEQQTAQSEALFSYTKQRDSIIDKNDSIAEIKDSVLNHFRDSLLGVSLEISRNQVELATRSFEIAERPFLTLKSIKFENFKMDSMPKVKAAIHNSGKVDALDFTNCATIIWDSVSVKNWNKFGDCKEREGVNIGSGNEAFITIPLPFRVDQQFYEDMSNNKKLLSVYLRGKYRRTSEKRKFSFGECRFYSFPEQAWQNCDNFWSPE